MKLRFSARIQSHLSGSQAWAHMRSGQEPQDDLDASDIALMKRIADAPRRKDGSVTVEVTEDDLLYLEPSISSLAAGSRDNIDGGFDEDSRDALADLNAANGLLHQIEKLQR